MDGHGRLTFLALVAGGLTLLLVHGGPVSAQLSTAEFRCQNTVAKQGRKLFRKTFKSLARCEDKISKGDLPDTTDCATEMETAAKIDDAEASYQQKLTQFCPDGVVAMLTFGGSCSGVTTLAALTTCATAEHEASAQELAALVYPRNVCASGYYYGAACVADADCPSGSLLNPGTCEAANQNLDSDQRRCQKLLGKTVAKEAAKRMGTIQKCKKRVSKGKLPVSTDCVASSQVKLGDLVTSSREKIALACPTGLAAPLAVAGTCAGATDTTAVQSCSLCLGDRKADELIAVQYGSSPLGVQAEAKQITDTADCVGGPLSRCRVNDYLLRNDKIRVVIQDLQRNLFGIGQYGGQIIDADLVRSSGPDRDNFEEWSVSLNIEATAHYTSLAVINDGSDGGPAVIRATGVDDLLDFLNPSAVVAGYGFLFPASANDVDLPVSIVTDYTLEPGKSYVRVDTTVSNSGGSPISIFFGEFLNGSGQVEIFQPGYGFGEPLVTSECSVPASPTPPDTPCLRVETLRNFVAFGGYDDGDGVSYGYIHNIPRSTTFTYSGVTVPQLGTDIVFALIGAASAPHNIPAGDSISFTRYFAVGENVSSVTDIRNDIQCTPTGRLTGMVSAGGNPAVNADVSIFADLAAAPSGFDYNVFTHTRTDASGNYALTLPPGNYTVAANFDGYPYEGGGTTPVLHPVSITATQTTTQNMALPATGGIQVTVTDENNAASPAKVSVVGFDASPDVENTQTVLIINNRTGVFGDFEDERPYGVANVTFVDPSGSADITIEPGDYQVVVSRGPEYSSSATNVTVAAAPNPPEVVTAKVEHVIDTDGFIGADFHVHSIDSPDSETKRTDRVLSLIGEGLDFFTPSDHDIRVDFAPTISAVGASNLLGTVTSSEMTTFDYGHFNAWPMTIDPLQINGGSVDHGGATLPGEDFPVAPYFNYSLSPADIIAAAHADPGTDTVQVNHVHSHLGLDDGSGLAIDTGVSPPQSTVPPLAHRLDPGVSNYFTNLPAAPAAEKFDALEIWIGNDRNQIYDNFLGADLAADARGGNLGDWFNLLNQGIISTGVADSDTHSTFVGVSGNPRTMVASPSDDPADLAGLAETLSANVNAGLSIGTNGPMVRVEVSALSTGEVGSLDHGGTTLIATTNGEVEIEVEIQSPEWAEFDRVEYYINTTTTRRTVSNAQTGAGLINLYRYRVTPDATQDVTPTLQLVAGTSSSRWEASTSLTLTGLTEDIWVVVLVKGRDNVSKPLYPVIPADLKRSTNLTLANLTDGNLGEDGVTALAFTNPLFVDVDGGGWTPPGLSVIIP